MIVTFVGHGKIVASRELISKITAAVESAILDGAEVFYCGHYGQFDYACAAAVKKLKEKYQNIKSVFVTPYITDGYQEKLKFIAKQNLYDEILYPEIENVPYKFAIAKRNEYMINCAAVIIAFIDHRYGGAYAAYLYARRKGKTVINLSQKNPNEI